jgi:hypothetical protein
VDCSEFPCIALFDRDMLERGEYQCEALSTKFNASAPSRAEVARETPGLESWVPAGLMLSSDPMLHSQLSGRWPARSNQLLARLSAMTNTGASASTAEACAWAAQGVKALEDGLENEPCRALQTHLGCTSDAAVDEDEYARHVSFGEATVAKLREQCGERIDSAVMLDCSSVPCLLAMPDAFRDPGDPSYCPPATEFASTTGMAAEPDVTVAVLYLSTNRRAESHIAERFSEERHGRLADLLWRYGTAAD